MTVFLKEIKVLQQSFAQILNETVTAAQAAFPQELEKLVILHTSSPDAPLVYAAPAVADHLKKNPAAIIEAAAKEQASIRDVARGESQKNYELAGINVDLITLNTNLIESYGQFTEEMDFLDNLEHEIGHMILRNGYSSEFSPNLRESAAMTYAMLRHIQRFGNKTNYEDGLAARIAGYIVFGTDTAHYTSDSLERAIQISKEKDISGFSLRETAALAEDIAGYYHPDDKTLFEINAAFIPAQYAFRMDKPPEVCMRKAVSVMKARRHNADIFRAGQRFFSDPGVSSLISEWARAASAKQDKPSYWQEAQKFIQDPTAKPPRYGLLRRLHLKL